MDTTLRGTYTGVRAMRGGLGMVADLLAVATFLGAALALATGTDAARALLALWVCALATGLLGWNVRLGARYHRLAGRFAHRARRSTALPRLTDAVDAVSHATRALLAGGADDAFVLGVQGALGHLAEMYGIATGAPCRVTVKILSEPPGHTDFAVRTVCRSSGSAGGRSETGTDWVNENTDFRLMLKEGYELFFCNDLPAQLALGYRNSHFSDRVIASGEYPYRATIVWPVRGRVEGSPDAWEVIGFVCVDTPLARVFDRAIDVAPGAAFAHALYSGLERFRQHAMQAGPRPDGGTP